MRPTRIVGRTGHAGLEPIHGRVEYRRGGGENTIVGHSESFVPGDSGPRDQIGVQVSPYGCNDDDGDRHGLGHHLVVTRSRPHVSMGGGNPLGRFLRSLVPGGSDARQKGPGRTQENRPRRHDLGQTLDVTVRPSLHHECQGQQQQRRRRRSAETMGASALGGRENTENGSGIRSATDCRTGPDRQIGRRSSSPRGTGATKTKCRSSETTEKGRGRPGPTERKGRSRPGPSERKGTEAATATTAKGGAQKGRSFQKVGASARTRPMQHQTTAILQVLSPNKATRGTVSSGTHSDDGCGAPIDIAGTGTDHHHYRFTPSSSSVIL